MSEPAHFNETRVCGEIQGFFRVSNGRIAGVVLAVDTTGEPTTIPVIIKDLPRVERGWKLFVKGSLISAREPGQKYHQLAVLAQWVEVLKPPPRRHT